MFDFEKLEVHKHARKYYTNLRLELKSNTSILKFKSDQIGRAALSVIENLAEGNASGTLKMKRRYFQIARASLVETVSNLKTLEKIQTITPKDFDEYYSKAVYISKMIFRLVKSLESRIS